MKNKILIVLVVLITILVGYNVTVYVIDKNSEKALEEKKEIYLEAGSNFVDEAIRMVNDSKNELGLAVLEDAIYYIPVSNIQSKSCIKLKDGGASPFGEWDYAYVIVRVVGYWRHYYFAALDKDNYGFLPASPPENGSEYMEDMKKSMYQGITDEYHGLSIEKYPYPFWAISQIDKGLVPIIPKTGDIITEEMLPIESRDDIRAIVLSVKDGKCVMPSTN